MVLPVVVSLQVGGTAISFFYVVDCVSDLCTGRFLLYAVNINTLVDAPNFPVQIDGHHAVNDPKKYST
jgi:hypothetical protein